MLRQLKTVRRNLTWLSVILLTANLVVGCATSGDGTFTGSNTGLGARIKACRAGDTPVASESQCLQDDAACYQISDNGWCTGERGTTCPTGSSQLPEGATCPPGTRCFQLSDSIQCAISFS